MSLIVILTNYMLYQWCFKYGISKNRKEEGHHRMFRNKTFNLPTLNLSFFFPIEWLVCLNNFDTKCRFFFHQNTLAFFSLYALCFFSSHMILSCDLFKLFSRSAWLKENHQYYIFLQVKWFFCIERLMFSFFFVD
jgi:hypothetical protein